jgi:hypothetical protein
MRRYCPQTGPWLPAAAGGPHSLQNRQPQKRKNPAKSFMSELSRFHGLRLV